MFTNRGVIPQNGRRGATVPASPPSFIPEMDDKYIDHPTFDDIQNVEMSSDDFFASMNNIFADED